MVKNYRSTQDSGDTGGSQVRADRLPEAVHGHDMQLLNSFRYLGVHIDSNLS